MEGNELKPRKKRRISVRISIYVLVVIGIFLSAEIQLRIVQYFNPSFIYYDQSYKRFRPKPLSKNYNFNLNSRGFNDIEYELEKPGNTFRIVALGASFAFGIVPYPHNYLTLTEKSLNLWKPGIEIINMGIPGIGPDHYSRVLAKEGLLYNPDMVIVNFFIGSMFETRIRHKHLHAYSYLVTLIGYLIKSRTEYKEYIIHKDQNYDDNRATLDEGQYLNLEVARSRIFLKSSKEFDLQLENVMYYLAGIKRFCDKKRIKMMVLFIPDEVQVNPILQASVTQSAGTLLTDYSFDAPNSKLASALMNNNIEFLDVTRIIRNSFKSEILYKPRNTHWNIAGNKLAAIEITKYLQKKIDHHNF